MAARCHWRKEVGYKTGGAQHSAHSVWEQLSLVPRVFLSAFILTSLPLVSSFLHYLHGFPGHGVPITLIVFQIPSSPAIDSPSEPFPPLTWDGPPLSLSEHQRALSHTCSTGSRGTRPHYRVTIQPHGAPDSISKLSNKLVSSWHNETVSLSSLNPRLKAQCFQHGHQF